MPGSRARRSVATESALHLTGHELAGEIVDEVGGRADPWPDPRLLPGRIVPVAQHAPVEGALLHPTQGDVDLEHVLFTARVLGLQHLSRP